MDVRREGPSGFAAGVTSRNGCPRGVDSVGLGGRHPQDSPYVGVGPVAATAAADRPAAPQSETPRERILMDMRFPVRVQRPEERELELKRQELAAVEADLVEQELHLSTLQAEFAAFKAEYLRVVGVRYAELDGIKARIAELRATQAPSDGAAQTAASKARATAESSAAEAHERVSREPTSPFDPPVEFKTLYRTIARRLHPDLAATDEERAYRHEWMAKVNDAYQRQDSEALAALLSAWETSPESVSGTGVSSDLVRVIRQIAQVRRRLDSIRRAIQALQAGALYTLHQKCNVRSDAGWQPAGRDGSVPRQPDQRSATRTRGFGGRGV